MWDLIVSVPDHCLSFLLRNSIYILNNPDRKIAYLGTIHQQSFQYATGYPVIHLVAEDSTNNS